MVGIHGVEGTLPILEVTILGGEPPGEMPVEEAAGAHAALARAGERGVSKPTGHGRETMARAAFAGMTTTHPLTSSKGITSGSAGGTTARPEGLISTGPSASGRVTCTGSVQDVQASFDGVFRSTQSAKMALSRFAS